MKNINLARQIQSAILPTPSLGLPKDQSWLRLKPGIRDRAQSLLAEVMKYRRMAGQETDLCSSNCRSCMEPHLLKVMNAISQNKPVTFVLPAFPGKSPNPAKVLGHLPDMAEQRALIFLNNLAGKLSSEYVPGVKIIICSDGRVFSDVVGMKESHVTEYQDEIDELISRFNLKHLDTFNLDELIGSQSFDQIRLDLMLEYGQELETLRAKVKRGGNGSEDRDDQDSHRLFCGITRFMFEDSLTPGQKRSKTSLQKDARKKAYDVILRSNAWSELIKVQFSDAIRLSIHPQFCGSNKLGIQLLATNPWMTPWHGVAVNIGNEFKLMKRWEAESVDARLVHDETGRPTHFQIPNI